MLRKLTWGLVPSRNALFYRGQMKHLLKWYLTHRRDYLLKHKLPWLTFDAVPAIELFVKPGMNVFEYGSGSSTLWWDKLGAKVVSVEHDPVWFNIVKSHLEQDSQQQIFLIPPDDVPVNNSTDPSDPFSYRTTHAGFENKTFRDYVSFIDRYPDHFFDVILIDGQARASCVPHALPKLSQNGLLIIDNANVEAYLGNVLPLLSQFSRVSYVGLAPIDGALSQTDLFFR